MPAATTAEGGSHCLSGTNVFITGANRGIGLGLVREFANVPGLKRLFAGCRRPADSHELHQICRSLPNPSLLQIVTIDVSSDQSIREALGQIRSEIGEDGVLNLLVNNAGILEAGGVTVQEPNREKCLRHFNTNTLGTMLTTAAFLPLLREAASKGELAAVVNVSGSLSQMEPMRPMHTVPNQNRVYGMSKIAINFYTKALSMDEPSILAVAVHPGWIRTDMGGTKAPLSVEEAAANFVQRFCGLNKEDSGKYLDWSDTAGRKASI